MLKKELWARITARTVEVFHVGQRVASHNVMVVGDMNALACGLITGVKRGRRHIHHCVKVTHKALADVVTMAHDASAVLHLVGRVRAQFCKPIDTLFPPA